LLALFWWMAATVSREHGTALSATFLAILINQKD
jgi:hypothetical protein